MGNLDLDGAINKLFEQETSEDMLLMRVVRRKAGWGTCQFVTLSMEFVTDFKS